MVGLRLAFPNDRRKDFFVGLLTRSGIARSRGGTLFGAVDDIDRIVGVSSTDLPVLLLDGVFDAVLTTADRVAECEASERKRQVPRPFGRVIPLLQPDGLSADSLVWGFPSRLLEGREADAEAQLYEMARGGIGFTPGRDTVRTVLCATTHPAIATEAFRSMGISADVRYYPDPWEVLSSSSTSYCALGLAGPAERGNRGLVLDTQHVLAEETPALVFNQVAWASSVKRPWLARCESALTRLVAAEALVKIEFCGSLEILSRVEISVPVRHTRVFDQTQEDGWSRLVEIVVEQNDAARVMDQLQELGARAIRAWRLYRADVRA